MSVPRDLSLLPDQVQRTARVDPNGEVSWSDSEAAAAITALTLTGFVVLGLDVRFYDTESRFHEIPWSSFEPDPAASDEANAERAREAALDALGRIDELEVPDGATQRRILITW